MNLSAILPPPYEVQRRGWEAAFVLCQDYCHRLAQHECERMAWLVALGPERLGWQEVAEAQRLHRSHVAVRT